MFRKMLFMSILFFTFNAGIHSFEYKRTNDIIQHSRAIFKMQLERVRAHCPPRMLYTLRKPPLGTQIWVYTYTRRARARSQWYYDRNILYSRSEICIDDFLTNNSAPKIFSAWSARESASQDSKNTKKYFSARTKNSVSQERTHLPAPCQLYILRSGSVQTSQEAQCITIIHRPASLKACNWGQAAGRVRR